MIWKCYFVQHFVLIYRIVLILRLHIFQYFVCFFNTWWHYEDLQKNVWKQIYYVLRYTVLKVCDYFPKRSLDLLLIDRRSVEDFSKQLFAWLLVTLSKINSLHVFCERYWQAKCCFYWTWKCRKYFRCQNFHKHDKFRKMYELLFIVNAQFL